MFTVDVLSSSAYLVKTLFIQMYLLTIS